MASDGVCVYCRQQPVDTTWLPFCSERCKLLDLRDWVSERYRVPGNSASEDSVRDDASHDGDDDVE